MEINVAKCRSPFADIQQFSEVQGEKEILFSMGTVFRICQVDKLPNGVWKVRLSLDGDEDTQLRQLTEHMRVELQGSHPLFTLGKLMKTLCQYDKAEYFYRLFMAEMKSSSDNLTEKAVLYSDLGTIYMDRRLYNEALGYFQQSLKYNPKSAECYGNLGLVCEELGQHEQALTHLHHAIDLDRNASVSSQKIAIQYNNLGTVHYKQNSFDQAKLNYEQALKLRLECLPPTHPDIAQSYSNIGAVSYAQRDYGSALSAFSMALEIKSASLPSDHPSLAITLNNIARTLSNQGEYEKALTNATKAVKISTKALTENHPQTQEFITSLQSIQHQLSKLKSN